MQHRLHVFSLPHTQTTRAFHTCAYTEKVRKFCSMMIEQGNTVYLYSGSENEASCSEHIICISEQERKAALGDMHYTAAPFNANLPHWLRFNTTAIVEVKKRAMPTDILCFIGGHAQKPIAEAFPNMLAVEFGVGYSGTFSQYRVFESYAWMHMCYGASGGDPCSVDGKWFDAVIPGYFDEGDFIYKLKPQDYLLYIGRMIDRKGIQVARDIARCSGRQLIMAGPGGQPADGYYLGEVGPEERTKLMANAYALVAPTLYIEPFGNVAVEAQACGTPVLCTDWGAFTETVEQGQTGFRCRTLKEFVDAVRKVEKLDRNYIHQRAVAKYSMRAVAPMYQQHFDRLATLWAGGWYEGTATKEQRKRKHDRQTRSHSQPDQGAA